jgi:hypothetical protein
VKISADVARARAEAAVVEDTDPVPAEPAVERP